MPRCLFLCSLLGTPYCVVEPKGPDGWRRLCKTEHLKWGGWSWQPWRDEVRGRRHLTLPFNTDMVGVCHLVALVSW